MSLFSAIGDFFGSEADHLGQLTNSLTKKPLPALLGAEDPVGAKLWGGITGQHFEPQLNVFGGETNTQYRTSQSRGYNTTYSRDLGYLADAIAVYEAGDYAYEAAGAGGVGAAAGAGGGAGAGAGAGAGGATAMGGAAGTLGAADSAAASSELGLTAADVGGTSGATAGAGAAGSASASSAWTKYGMELGKGLAPVVASNLLQPKPPKTKAPTPMPDPLAQQQAQRQKLIDQLARRGRTSTILTNPSNGGGALGG